MGNQLLSLAGGVMEGAADAQAKKTQKDYYDLLQKKMKTELDLELKKHEYISKLPADSPLRISLETGMKPEDVMLANLAGMYGGAKPMPGPGAEGQPQPQPSVGEQIAGAQMGGMPGGAGWDVQAPSQQQIYDALITGDKRALGRPKVFWQENGDEFILRDEYGKVVGTRPRKVKPEMMDIELPGGAKGKRPYHPFTLNGLPVTGWQHGQPPQTVLPPGVESQASGVPEGVIQTAPQQGEVPERASKIQLAQSGMKAFGEMKSLVLGQGNDPDRVNIINSSIGTPFTQGRQISSLAFKAIDAVVRAATGAGMPKSEMDNYLAAYTPSVFDNGETIASKMAGLEDFLNGYIAKMDPTGTQQGRTGPASTIRKPIPTNSPSGKPKTADEYLKAKGIQ